MVIKRTGIRESFHILGLTEHGRTCYDVCAIEKGLSYI